MTVTVEIAGRSYAVPPFMIADVEQAAPHIDRMRDLAEELKPFGQSGVTTDGRRAPMATVMALFHAQIEILAIGIRNVDVAMTAETLAKSVNFTFMPSLQVAVNEILLSAGLSPPGETKAPKARPAKGAKASRRR